MTPVPTIVTKKGQAIDLAVNEETTQLDEPVLVDMFHYGHLDEEKLKLGLQKEMEAMRDFDVYTEVDKDSLPPETLQGAIDTRFECKNKDDEVRARLVVKDYWREVSDKDDIYASTPLLLTVKLLLLIALQFGFGIQLGDISTALLHAPLLGDFYVWPPKEYYPARDKPWKLKKALYGLRDAPKAWQEHFAEVLQDMGGRRFKSDSNLYYFSEYKCFMLVYVDDVMIVGLRARDLFTKMQEKVLLRETGELTPGKSAKFLGRVLHHAGTTIFMRCTNGYIQNMLEQVRLRECNDSRNAISLGLQEQNLMEALFPQTTWKPWQII